MPHWNIFKLMRAHSVGTYLEKGNILIDNEADI